MWIVKGGGIGNFGIGNFGISGFGGGQLEHLGQWLGTQWTDLCM